MCILILDNAAGYSSIPCGTGSFQLHTDKRINKKGDKQKRTQNLRILHFYHIGDDKHNNEAKHDNKGAGDFPQDKSAKMDESDVTYKKKGAKKYHDP